MVLAHRPSATAELRDREPGREGRNEEELRLTPPLALRFTRRPNWVGFAVVAAACAWTLSPRLAWAQEYGHVMGSVVPGRRALLLIPAALLPSALGPEVAFEAADRRDARFVLAWPFQLPIPLSKARMASHRAIAAVELALGTANGARWRGRAGYRYAGAVLMAGGGVGVDNAAWFLSPELGLRLPRLNPEPGFHPYATLVLRADVPPSSPEQSRLSLMVGWMAF